MFGRRAGNVTSTEEPRILTVAVVYSRLRWSGGSSVVRDDHIYF
jgi:hypothetical protein